MCITYGRASFELNANSLNSLSMRISICIRVDRPQLKAQNRVFKSQNRTVYKICKSVIIPTRRRSSSYSLSTNHC